MTRGLMSVVYTVHCGGCGGHFTPSNGLQTQASTTGREAKRLGWEQTRAFGWLCPKCAVDTAAVIMADAGAKS